MPESAAQSWLSGHNSQLPALDVYHQQALETLENKASPLAQLADIIAQDPGMSISLYRQVNGRQKKSGRSTLGTIQCALGMLGETAISDFVVQHETLGKTLSNTEVQQVYHQLMSQGFHLLSQLDLYASLHGVASVNEIKSAAILYNIGELYTCLFDYETYRKYRGKHCGSGNGVGSAKAAFGFQFQELGHLLASQWCLPDLLLDALSDGSKTSRKARLIRLAANISRQTEVGWNHPELQAAMKASAEFLERSPHEIEAKTRSVAIQSARDFPVADVFPAAARLILLPDVSAPVSVVKSPEAGEIQSAIARLTNTIRQLLRSPGVTPTQIIKTAIEGLYKELKFSRAVLITPSRDGQTLKPCLCRGLPPGSPFNSLQIKTAQSGLFKSLMSKPQALWVNPANFQKYSVILPGTFRAASLSENFFLMSLFIGKKPVGFVYCDRTSTEKKLDQSLYSEFKSCIMMTNKALTFVARRNKEKAA